MRKVRKKFADNVGMSITSLLDVLTILLVFMIKNVSMETERLTAPENMRLPSTITNQALLDNGLTVIVKMYPDQVMIGSDNLHVGSLKQLVEDAKTREIIFAYMQNEAAKIAEMNTQRGTDYKPVLLIQADKEIICQYITQMVKIGAGASFADIYFTTLMDENWLQRSAVKVQ